MSKERLVGALRRSVDDAVERKGAHGVIGEVKAVGSGSGGLKVHIPDHDFLLDDDDLHVAQAVAQYDQDYGIAVGDSLVCVPARNGDYMAVAILPKTEPTQRKTGGGLNSITGGPPAAGSGQDGDFALNPATGAIYGPKAAGVWPAAALAVGGGGGMRYTYSNDTAATDPTSGKVKFNSTTLASINTVRISETDFDGNNLAAWIATFDDSTTAAHRGTLVVVKDGAPTSILILDVTSALTDNGTWDNFTVAVLASNGSFTNGDPVRILFVRTGDTGAVGGAGPTGPAGPSGGAPLAYAEMTTSVSVTGTNDAGATPVVTAPAFTADGTSSYWVEFYAPQVVPGTASGDFVFAVLFEGSPGTVIGRMGLVQMPTQPNGSDSLTCRVKVTPAAGSRTYSVRAFRNSTNGTISGGVGGGSALLPAFIRVTNDNNAGPAGPIGPAGPTGAGQLLAPTAKSGAYTAVSNDYVICTNGGYTITLPSPTSGRILGIKAASGQTNASPVTITTPSGVILGPGVVASATSILLGTPGAYVTLLADGTNWHIVDGEQDTGWISTGTLAGGYAGTFQYRKQGNVVRIMSVAGAINPNGAATGTAFYTMPAGFRPPVQLSCACSAYAAAPIAALFTVVAAGTMNGYYAAAATQLDFDGISWTVD